MMFIGTLDPTSTRQGWTQIFEIDDEDTDEPVDLTGASIVIEVRDPRSGWIALSGTTDNGKVTIIDTGVFQVSFARSETENLAPLDYEIGAVIFINGAYNQLIIGILPILDGIVTT